MKTLNIDLAEKGPAEQIAKELESTHKYYPTLYVSTDEPLELPDSGVLKIKFQKAASTERMRDGKKGYECTIEVRELVSVEDTKENSDDSPSKKHDESGDALDKLAAEKSKSKGY